MSISTLIISFFYRCPPPIFFFLEAAVNGLMIIEVLARFAANRRMFWDSFWNRVDAILMVFCLITLGLIIFGHHQCHAGQVDSTKEVEIVEQIILILRNGMSFSRSLSLIQRYFVFNARNTISLRPIQDLDIDSVPNIPLNSIG